VGERVPSAGEVWVLDSTEEPRQVIGQPIGTHRRNGRRRRRWLVWVVLALVVSYGSAVGIDALTTGTASPPAAPPTPTLHARTDVTLVWGLDSLHVINADTGAARTVSLPNAHEGVQMFVSHGSLLVNAGNVNTGHAWFYGNGPTQPPLDLGPSSRITITPSGNGVWLWETGTVAQPNLNQVRLVDFMGHSVTTGATLPKDWFPTGEAVDQGLIIHARLGDALQVWDPTSGKVMESLPGGFAEIALTGHGFEWVADTCRSHCVLYRTELHTSQTGVSSFEVQDIALPPAVRPVDCCGAFSPDGSTLAMSVLIGPFTPVGPPGHPYSEHSSFTAVVVVDLVHGTARLLPGSIQKPSTTFGVYPLTWSPNGWLFFADYGSRQVEAWRPGLKTAGVLSLVRLPGLAPPNIYGLPSMVAVNTGHWVARGPSSTVSR
jgi:WD40 repeat protein